MASAFWYRMILVWIHLVAATFWIGGMLFLSLVAAPLFRRESSQPHDWFVQVARRFRTLAWGAVLLLFLTGALLLSSHVSWRAPLSAWPWVVKGKLAMVIVLIGLSLVHDRLVGPRVRMIARKDRTARTAWEKSLVLLSPWFARLTLLSGLGVLWMGIVLART